MGRIPISNIQMPTIEREAKEMMTMMSTNSGDILNVPAPVGVSCYQWKGDNFEDISKEVQKNLSGYVYKKDDDLIIDYNDGNSVQRVKPLDWVLVCQEENDVCVMSDKMFNIIQGSRIQKYVSVSADVDQQDIDKPNFDDQGVNIKASTNYGDDVYLFASPTSGNMTLDFRSYQGDSISIDYKKDTEQTNIKMSDRYGNSLTAQGHRLSVNATYGVKTTNQMYEKIHDLTSKAQSKVIDVFCKLDKYIDDSKKKAT